jgi:murein DD-endopeptidase MepM/ murein hydrolase activator NlpD
MDALETRILNTLMSNLSDQLISRSNGSVDSYVQETESLLDLSRRLNKFSQSEDAAEIDLTEYRQALDSRLLRIPTLRPVSGRISSGFGYRTHPVYRHRHFHSGLDIVASRGTSIKAAATGYVSEAGYNSSMGYYIKISHGNGFTTVYMHCQKLSVSRGQTVTKGQTIATVGSTGTSTGPHLHYEIHIHGTPVNPSRFIME